MTHLSREACIELGVSVPTTPLIGWATEQLAAAKAQEQRLQRRGIHATFLKAMERLIEKVGDSQSALGKTTLPAEVAQAQRTREEAFAFWETAKQIAKVEFGTRPEIQAEFHLGVRSGRLIANLRRELESILTPLRAHQTELAWLGVDEAFLRTGESMVGRLQEAQAQLDASCRTLHPQLADHCFDKGALYDLTRKLVRIGRLEFFHEPEQAAAFNYGLLRRELRAGSQVRVQVGKSLAR